MKLYCFAILILLAALLAPFVHADVTSRPSAGGTPTEVRMQLLLLDLQSISAAEQNFTANFAWAARWNDERLRHDDTGSRTVSLSDIWHPRLQLINRQRLQKSFPDTAQVSPEGEVVVVQRVWGQFSQPLVLHDFPYDHQKLNIELLATMHEPGSVVLVPDEEFPSNVRDGLSISDWSIESWVAEALNRSIARTDRTSPGFNLSLKVERRHRYHLVNVILPLLMIICMSWVVFFIHPKNANPRISVSVTAMLTLIAYRFAVGASLPKSGYLTRMDWFILGSSVLVFTSLLEVVVTYYLAENDKVDVAVNLNRRMRVIAPIALGVIVWASLIR